MRLVSLLLLAQSVTAIYNDEVYKTDWHFPSVGQIGSTLTHEGRILITSPGLLSCFNQTTGELLWRKDGEFQDLYKQHGDVSLFSHDLHYTLDLDSGILSESEPVEAEKESIQFSVDGNNVFINDKPFTFNEPIIGVLSESIVEGESFYHIVGTEVVLSKFKYVAHANYQPLQDLHEQDFIEEQERDLLSAYLFRLKNNLSMLRSLLSTKMNVQVLLEEPEKDDYFGFDQSLILATENGAITSFDTRNGTIQWTRKTPYTDISALEISPEGEVRIITPTVNVTLEGHHYELSAPKQAKLWKFQPQGTIVKHIVKPETKTVNIGYIMGDRTVLYKYLKQNLEAYAVENNNQLTVYILDSTTGEVLFSAVHNGIYLPNIQMVFGEHWLVYTFFSEDPVPEQKLHVVEFYQSLESDTKSDTPHFVSQAYLFPERIQNLGLSSTRHGITTSAIIVELENGQLTYLPKSMLNARSKPEKEMTDVEKREFMAAPYTSTIPLNDHFVVSHRRQLIGCENLASFATNLESTSIVCSYGTDVFCTKISPSSQFDKLTASFDKMKLIISILIVTFAAWYVRPMVANKNVTNKWVAKKESM